MPRIPTRSPATDNPVPPHFIHTTAGHFVDNHSRVLILRGVNLCGSDKTPVGAPSYVLDGFWESVESGDGASFKGRPLGSLEDGGEADMHLTRLRGWGFTLLRYVFTWEALERFGPGKYDEEFIDYTIKALQKCKAHGFKLFMDPHQDTWSRFTGGDGAPYWTLQACGINPRHLSATQAAILHNEYPDPTNPDPALLPAMIWGTNYSRMACQTLFTLFFAGRDFAPKCIIDGQNIQDYLQGHFIRAVGHLAKRIKEADLGLFDECIIGWDSINEPFEGYCGLEDIRVLPSHQALKKGSCPTPAEGLRLAMGKPQTVEWWDFGSFGPKRNGTVTIDPDGVKLWIDPDVADEDENGVSSRWGWKRDPQWKLGECIWALHGVWDPALEQEATLANPKEAKDILKPDYFLYPPQNPSHRVDFLTDYWRELWRGYVGEVRKHHPESIHFVQPPVFMAPPPMEDDDLRGRGCYSPHYYDGLTLMTRHWNWFNADALGVLRGKYSNPVFAVKVGEVAIRKSIREQLGELRKDALDVLGAYPTVLGEIGIPMDMDSKWSYGGADGVGKGRGDYSRQVKALDASLQGADGPNAMGYTVWTFCPDSTHRWGDGWNLEDLSLWCADDERHGKRTKRVTSYDRTTAKDGTQMTIRPVQNDTNQNEDDDEEDGASIVGFQVSSSTLQLDKLVNGNLEESLSASIPTVSSSKTVVPLDSSTPGPSFPNFLDASLAYAFLTNGARAWRAFVRAYPLAVVGMPLDWEFDIVHATFQLKVRVTWEDGVDQSVEDQGTVTTEIFVPLLHFANDMVVQRAFGIVPLLRPIERDDSVDGSPTVTTNSTAGSKASLLDESSRKSKVDGLEGSMDLEVETSGGKWEMVGQVLKWSYPIPPRPDNSPKSPLSTSSHTIPSRPVSDGVEHHISIRRKGGAINFATLGVNEALVGVGVNTSRDSMDKICRDCVIM